MFLACLFLLLVQLSMNGLAKEVPEFNEEVPYTDIPVFLSQPLKLTVLEGENVTFPCLVDDIGGYVRLWRKGVTKVLFAGIVRVVRDSRVSLSDNSSLVIQSVIPSDAGDYNCQISTSPLLELAHRLDILMPPSIFTNPRNGDIVVKKGEKLVLSCEATGFPQPDIVWTALEGRLPAGEQSGSLIIDEVEESDSGIFQCTANNGVGEPASEKFHVKVLYAPEIEVPFRWIHAGETITMELSCIVHAEPMAVVQWLRSDNSTVEESSLVHMKISGNSHVLQIRKVTAEDFGTYICKATNAVGTTTETIQVSGLASPVIFQSSPNGDDLTSFQLKWIVKSYNPVIEYLLRFRKINENSSNVENWIQVMIPAERQTGLIQTQHHTITGLQGATSYEAVMQARNDFGWNQPSSEYLFATKGKVISKPIKFPVTSESGENYYTSAVETKHEQTEDKKDNGASTEIRISVITSFLTVILVLLFSH